MIDLSECGDPLNEINALAEVCEPGTLVIALGRVNDVRLYRQLMASGIHDYLLKPVSAAQLKETLTQAREAATAPRPGASEGGRSHIATAVIGTRGGKGSSGNRPGVGQSFDICNCWRSPTQVFASSASALCAPAASPRAFESSSNP